MNPTTWHKVISQGIDRSVDNPAVQILVRSWEDESSASARPARNRFEAQCWPALQGSLMMLCRAGADDFQVCWQGAAITAVSQVDATGCTLSQLGGEMDAFVKGASRDALDAGRPLYTVHLNDPGHPVFSWEQLLLPLVDDDGQAAVLVYRRALEWRHDRLEAMLGATSSATLCLRALTDERGVVLDWLMLSANPALGRMFGLEDGTLVGQTVAAALPHWSELDLTADCVAAMRFGTAREVNRLVGNDNGELRQIAVHVGPLTDGVVLTLSDLTRLLQPRQAVHRLVGTDGLTGLADRREFEERLRAEVLCARRAGDGLSLVLAEIDRLPVFEQARGRRAADDVVRRVARLFAAACEREQDLVARTGPQTFALLLPATDGAGAAEVVARLRRAIDQLGLPHGARLGPGGLSLSLGLASFRRDGDEVDLLERAEHALLEARLAGGHRVVVDPGSISDAEHAGCPTHSMPLGHGPLPGMETHDVELPELALREAGFVDVRGGGLFGLNAMAGMARATDAGRARVAGA